MIQLTLGGPRIVEDDEWVAQQREFAQRHCVVFKDFVDEGILGRVPRMLETGWFHCEHAADTGEVFSRELQMRARERLPQTFFLLLNQPRLFGAIAEFTGCEAAIRRFSGRCFKQLPGGGHFTDWHSDTGDGAGRMFGLTINLSPKPCGGGFQIRSRKTGGRGGGQTVTGTRFGDACLFRIHEFIEHRTLPVEGPVPRCIYGGWFFGAGADHRELMRKKLRPLGDRAGSPPRPSG